MRNMLSFVSVVAGIIIGFYIAFDMLFIPGLVGIIEQCKAETVDATILGWSIAKILFSWVSLVLCYIIGVLTAGIIQVVK